MADEVQFTDEQWETVAKAAEMFAGVLKQERLALGNVLTSNWAGECAEGLGTMENLRALLQDEGVGSFSGAIILEAKYLTDVASQCRAARTDLSAIDVAGAIGFEASS